MIIKEVYKQEGRSPIFILRKNTYSSTLAKFLELYNEARKEFPNLQTDEVRVVHFGGERYKYTFGIEFYAITTSIPEGYTQIGILEYLL